MPALSTAKAGANITVQATPMRAGRPTGVLISTPYLRIRAQQMAPTQPARAADPGFGNWLDV